MSFAKKVVNRLCKKKFKISIAESCTGGLISSSITSIAGSSKVFKIGLITYSNESKIRLLKVSKKKIFKYGAVSKEVCLDMLKNVAKKLKEIPHSKIGHIIHLNLCYHFYRLHPSKNNFDLVN